MVLAWRWFVSILFVVQNAIVMLVLGIVFFPWAVVSSKGALKACKLYARWAIWTARILIGLKSEVRGHVPSDEVMVAAKHQSFFDILLIFNALPAPKFIMKRELLWTPIIGLYAYRLGCIPVDRGRRGQAIKKMIADVASGAANPGQLVIYSQGTRVRPGEMKPYKIGTFALASQLGQACVPAATNAGLFWPKGTMLRKPGLAVVEFLEPMSPTLDQNTFMAQLEASVEARSDALMQEAGFDAGDRNA
ncbi:1-acyl-sn-glycerol-3-phosphate acyltransferase [Rhodobacteraceae bacterium LMO-12]|nr:1-acyl-sn-glycerol-3-phosphate acyltransferase [Rhodobacteraceae bacterium LMO-JJ12]